MVKQDIYSNINKALDFNLTTVGNANAIVRVTITADDGKLNAIRTFNVNVGESSNVKKLQLTKGWNMISIPVDLTLNEDDIKTYFNQCLIIWTYKNGIWYVQSLDENIQELLESLGYSSITSIEKNQGFWAYTEYDALDLTFTGNTVSKPSLFSSGWSLLGSGSNSINVDNLFLENFEYIWSYENAKWQVNSKYTSNVDDIIEDGTINKLLTLDFGQGFWVNVEYNEPLKQNQ